MTDEPLELISALFDGEPVDPAALSYVLARPEGRDALADFAMLRARVLADGEKPRAGFAEDVRLGIARAVGPRSRGLLRLAAAAAVLTATFLGGLWLGERETTSVAGVPVPDDARVVRFVHGEDWSPLQ